MTPADLEKSFLNSKDDILAGFGDCSEFLGPQKIILITIERTTFLIFFCPMNTSGLWMAYIFYFDKGTLCVYVRIINVRSCVPSAQGKNMIIAQLRVPVVSVRAELEKCLLACGKTAPAGRLQLSK